MARVKVGGRHVCLGTYRTEEEAANIASAYRASIWPTSNEQRRHGRGITTKDALTSAALVPPAVIPVSSSESQSPASSKVTSG